MLNRCSICHSVFVFLTDHISLSLSRSFLLKVKCFFHNTCPKLAPLLWYCCAVWSYGTGTIYENEIRIYWPLAFIEDTKLHYIRSRTLLEVQDNLSEKNVILMWGNIPKQRLEGLLLKCLQPEVQRLLHLFVILWSWKLDNCIEKRIQHHGHYRAYSAGT